MVTSVDGALTNIATGGSSNSQNQLNDMGFDTFLKLLVTQLENQDPLNPMDGTQFTEQLATFSQLEQQMQSNTYLEELSKARDYSAQTLAVSYIGNEVLAPAGQLFASAEVGLPEDGQVSFAYELEGTASSASLEIRDNEGVLVRTLDMTGSGSQAGITTVVWDGKDEAGEQLEEGFYTVQISARNGEGTKVPHRLYTYSPVSAVAADESNITLNLLDGREVSFDEILQVQGIGLTTEQDES